ncbi:DNA polymerase I [Burkholderia phage BcepNY3]|uniref:DNA polymerase I n=1 Tax=Burkholderia phage BcepNY3 TaxID=2881397 RepID=A6N3H3_9CAUD|nr:DNA polymerase [Burkholderia phage BcepNY3]ABR10600.1 DNA polymerase I [Burkholderia phage BcepNY3]
MTERLLFLDFETSSHTDLTEHGLGRYLADQSTRAYCFTFRLPGMSTADLWEVGQRVPEVITRHVRAGHLFVAHNAPFDFWIWNTVLRRQRGYHDLPELQIGQVRCSAARARYNGLPGSLAGACEALGLPVQKDTEGAKWMKEIAANPDWTPADHPEHFARTYKYALIDTDAMVGVWENTVPLPAREQAYFEMDMRINARGIGVDVEAAQAMEDLKAFAEAQLDYEMAYLTDGGVLAVSEVEKIKTYAATLGEDMDDAGRETLKKIAARDNLPDSLRQLIELRLDASRAPKKSAAILRAHVGGRLQHSTIYHGALSGRSTARGAGGAQTLNTARPRPGKKTADCEAILDACLRHDRAYLSSPEVGPILAALADAQRQLFRATQPGHVLVGADLSGIEARFSPWIAGDLELLEAFEKGVDPYKLAAAAIFQVTYEAVTKDQRQIGKVAMLALTYGGGAGAFVSMAANYGVHLPPEQVDEIVLNWRAARPAFERWWSLCEYSVLMALDQPNREITMPIGRDFCSHVTFVHDGRALRMQLPSGRAISYHNARLHLEPGANVPIAIYDKPEGYIETLDRKILSNNMTQGLARDLFWSVLLDVDRVEQIVHHVYDEALLEVREEVAELRCDQLVERMCRGEAWCPGLPLGAEGWFGLRWRKD